MKIKHILFFSFLLLFFTSLQVTAEIRYVSKTGSSTYPYTSWETAADSIQKAINASNHGDTIIVANGIYKETLVIDKQVHLLGSSMDSTVIDSRGLSGVISEWTTVDIKSDNVKIENIWIYGKGNGEYNVTIKATDYNLYINNCLIEHFGTGTGISLFRKSATIQNSIIKGHSNGIDGGCTNRDCTFIINNCVILPGKRSYATGIIGTFSGGHYYITNNLIITKDSDVFGRSISLVLEQSSHIKNNLIAGAMRIQVKTGSFTSQMVIIENNTIVYQPPDGNYAQILLYAGGNRKISNNIIAYTLGKGISSESQDIDSDYNLFWQVAQPVSGLPMGAKDIIADPMFVKDTLPWTSEADFHLQAYSPAIDAGDPDILDVDGSRSDIGMYGGPGGTKYYYLDLPPRTPRNFTLTYDSLYTAVHFKWNMNTERDFSHYNIYRDTVSGFSISEANKIFETDTSVYCEVFPSMKNVKYYYRITAVDSQMNESTPGEELSVIISSSNKPELEVISQYQLYQNYPNPFNPSTRISYNLKERGYVKVNVYSITGELIENLVNEHQEAGYYEVEFNAEVRSQKSGVRSGMASGIYLYRIEVIGEGNIPRYADMKKMILIK